MTRKTNLLDNFYGIKESKKENTNTAITEKEESLDKNVNRGLNKKSVVTTFMINKDYLAYINLRSKTGFNSKSEYINWLIAEDKNRNTKLSEIADALKNIN